MDKVIPPNPPSVGEDKPSISEEVDFMKELEVPKPEKKGLLRKIFQKQEKEVVQKDLSNEDLTNIRSALGVQTEKKEPSIREKFEEDIEQKEPEKHDWDKPPDLTDILIKNVKERKPVSKVKVESEAESHFEQVHSDMESSKQEMMAKAEKRKPDVLKSKQKIRTEYEKYQVKIKKHANDEHKRVSSVAKEHERNLNKKIAALNAKATRLTEKEKRIAIKEAKVLKTVENLKAKQDKVNEQAKIMDEYAKEIKILDGNFQQMKVKTAKEKAEFDNIKKSVYDEKSKLKNARSQFDKFERAHQGRVAKLQSDLKKAYEELDRVNNRSKTILTTLENKEKSLTMKETHIAKLVEEEKRMVKALKSSEMDLEPPVMKELSFEEPYKEKFMAVQKPVSPSDDLHGKIEDCRQLLEEQNFEDAKILYNEIREEFLTAGLSDSESDAMKVQIKDLYDHIALKIVNG